MAFMQRQIYKGDYYEAIAGHGGTWIVPTDASGTVKTQGELQDYVEDTIDDPGEAVELKHGWLARMSAPGYLDCTDWSAFETEAEAEEYLSEYYGDEDEEEDEDAV